MNKLILFLLFLLIGVNSYSQDELYYACKHEINLDSVEYQIVGIKGADSVVYENKLLIIPTGKLVTVKIITNHVEGSLRYKVKPTPLPDIKLYYNRKNITELSQLHLMDSTLLVIKAVPNKDFANLYPRESRYRVIESVCEHYRNGELIYSESQKGRNTWNLSKISIVKNDVLVFRITKVVRMNFRNQIEEINVDRSFQYQVDR